MVPRTQKTAKIMRHMSLRTLILTVLLLAVPVVAGPLARPAQAQVDPNTLLYLAFEETLTGAQGQVPTQAVGVSYEVGVVGLGGYFAVGNQVRYAAEGNINALEGTLEFWIKPRWNGNDGQTYTILAYGGSGGMLFAKDGANNLRSIFNRFGAGGQPERGVALNVSDWLANQWHHVAYTWSSSAGSLKVYVDGSLRAQSRFTGALPLVNSTTFQIGADNLVFPLDAVLDELRISNVTRSDAEIADSFVAGLTVFSLSIEPAAVELLETWWRKPVLIADTNVGIVNIPPRAATWSSSDPTVATVDIEGRIRGVSQGTATLTATISGTQASVAVTVQAPVRRPEEEIIDLYLATPMSGFLYEMPVVILQYLPTTDGVNVDSSVAGWESTLDNLRTRIDTFNKRVKFMLEEGSRFRGYQNPLAEPSLGYRVVHIVTVYEPIPPDMNPAHPTGTMGVYFPDYEQILTRFDGQLWVENEGMKEFWIWGYHYGSIAPVESNMSSPTTGDISNSFRFEDDLPIFNKTYTVYNYNFTRTQAEAVHNHGHQLEAILGHANRLQDGNTDLFWKLFVGQDQNGNFITGRAGWTHMPPNTTVHYDYLNMTPVDSDIEDWTPAGTGQRKAVDASTWGNLVYAWPGDPSPEQKTESQWYIYWMQNMPGRGNVIPYNQGSMTNWWQFTGDWDQSVSTGEGLHTP
jgi:hypothetical protein